MHAPLFWLHQLPWWHPSWCYYSHSASSLHVQNNHYKKCCKPADVSFSLLDITCKELSVLLSPGVSPCDWLDFNFTTQVIIFYVSLWQDLKSWLGSYHLICSALLEEAIHHHKTSSKPLHADRTFHSQRAHTNVSLCSINTLVRPKACDMYTHSPCLCPWIVGPINWPVIPVRQNASVLSNMMLR